MSIDKIEPGLQGAEGDLAVTVGPDLHDRGRDQVEVVALPYVGVDDPPAAYQAALDRRGHRDAPARSFGILVRS